MPSIKKKTKRVAARAIKAQQSNQNQESVSNTPQPDRKYLDELLREAKMLAYLQQKKSSGEELSQKEENVFASLCSKRDTIEKNTRDLKEAGDILAAALAQRDDVRAICKVRPANSSKTQQAEAAILHLVERDYRTALRYVKDKLFALFEQEWVVRTMLGVMAAGTIGWVGHRTVVSATEATTELLREANLMTQTIQTTKELIQTTSHEGAKWTFAALGGATGATHGLLLGALLPGPSGKSSVSALTAAAMGMYAGWHSL